VVVAAIEGVVYVLLVCPAIAVPPDATVYHRYWPAAPPLAESVTVPVPHRAAAVVVGAAGIELMVAVTGERVPSQNPLFRAT
jgi:hypothetical protein